MHRHESQHGAEVHNPAGGQAPYRNPADHCVDIGRDCDKRDAALHDSAHLRGGKLPPGAPASRAAAKEAHQETAVKPNTPLCGPVCGFEGQVGERRQESPRPALLEPCGAVVGESSKTGTAQIREQPRLSP